MRAVLLTLLFVPFAGCLWYADDCGPLQVVPGDLRWSADPTTPFDVLAATEGVDTRPASLAGGTLQAVERLDGLTIARTMPSMDSMRLRLGDPCSAATIQHHAIEEGIRAAPGQGVHVYTAGFWENGTLFYTNHQALHDMTWARAGWYEFSSPDALQVYVYDADPSERGPEWGTGLALDPALPLESVGTPWNYFVTIPGFNEALKDLSVNTERVVRVAAEDAYTREGNEEHPLYGDALVFWIRAVEVRSVPCPMMADDGLCIVGDP